MSWLDQEEIYLFNGLIYQYLLDYPRDHPVGVTARELREHYGLSPRNSYKFAAVLCKHPRLFYLIGQECEDGDGQGSHFPQIRYYISLKNLKNRPIQPPRIRSHADSTRLPGACRGVTRTVPFSPRTQGSIRSGAQSGTRVPWTRSPSSTCRRRQCSGYGEPGTTG